MADEKKQMGRPNQQGKVPFHNLMVDRHQLAKLIVQARRCWLRSNRDVRAAAEAGNFDMEAEFKKERRAEEKAEHEGIAVYEANFGEFDFADWVEV